MEKLNRTPFGRVDPNIVDRVDTQNVIPALVRRRPRRKTTTADGVVVGKKKLNLLDVDDSEYDFLEKELKKKSVKQPPLIRKETVVEFDSKRKTPKISNCVVVPHHDAADIKKKKNQTTASNHLADNSSVSSLSSLGSLTSIKINSVDRRKKEDEQLVRRKKYWKKRLNIENGKQRKKDVTTKNNNTSTGKIETKKQEELKLKASLSVKTSSNVDDALDEKQITVQNDAVGYIGNDRIPLRLSSNNQKEESNAVAEYTTPRLTYQNKTVVHDVAVGKDRVPLRSSTMNNRTGSNAAAEYTTPMLLLASQNKIVNASKKLIFNSTPYLFNMHANSNNRQEKNVTTESIQRNETKNNTNSSHEQQNDHSENHRLTQLTTTNVDTDNAECDETSDDDDEKSETTYESNTVETNSNDSDEIEDLQSQNSTTYEEDGKNNNDTSSVKSSSPEQDSDILDRENTSKGEEPDGINLPEQHQPFNSYDNDELPEIWSWEHAIQAGTNNQISELIREPVFTIDGKLFKHPPMPPGWQLKISESRNRPYYMHPDFGVTWHAPVALPTISNVTDRPNRFDQYSLIRRNVQHRTAYETPPSPIDIDSDVPNVDVSLAIRKREGISSVDLLTNSEALSFSIKKQRTSPIDSTSHNESQTPMSSSDMYRDDPDDRMNHIYFQSSMCASTRTKKSSTFMQTPSIHVGLSNELNEGHDEHMLFQSNVRVSTTTKKRSSMKTPRYETQRIYDETITMSERSTSIVTHHLRQRRQTLFIDTPIENQYLPYEPKLEPEIGILPNDSTESPVMESPLPYEISFQQKKSPAETHSAESTSIPDSDNNDSTRFKDNNHVTAVEYETAQTPSNFSSEDISRSEKDSHISEHESDILFLKQRSITTPKMFATNKIVSENNNNLSTSSDATPQTSRDFSPDDIPCSGQDKQNQDSDISFFQPSSIKTPKTFRMHSRSPENYNNLSTSSDDDINVASAEVCIEDNTFSEEDMPTSSHDSNIKFLKPVPISTPNVLCSSNRIITDPTKAPPQYTKSGHRIRVGYETLRALEPTMPLCQLQVLYLLPILRAAERRRQKLREDAKNCV